MTSSSIIRLDISYDGTHYKGYQRQPKDRTIQGEIEKALAKIYKQPVSTVAAGRTDKGVHAIHQVVSFSAPPLPVSLSGLKKGLNSLLPPDIRINQVQSAHTHFHARFSSFRRTYLYVIYNGSLCPPFLYSHVWWVPQKISVGRLRKSLKYLRGTHDFTSFCERPEKENRIRTLYSIRVKKKSEFIYVYIWGNSFLRRMIRVIMGTAVGIATQREGRPKMVKEILEARERAKNPFPSAPPSGLYFYRVDFKVERKRLTEIFRFLKKPGVFLPKNEKD